MIMKNVTHTIGKNGKVYFVKSTKMFGEKWWHIFEISKDDFDACDSFLQLKMKSRLTLSVNTYFKAMTAMNSK
jgi:hypothetical protein